MRRRSFTSPTFRSCSLRRLSELVRSRFEVQPGSLLRDRRARTCHAHSAGPNNDQFTDPICGFEKVRPDEPREFGIRWITDRSRTYPSDKTDATNVKLVQVYGLSETGFLAGLRDHEHTEDRLTSCGRPCPGIEVQVVDDEGKEVATGQHGELVARGANVMRGYWNN